MILSFQSKLKILAEGTNMEFFFLISYNKGFNFNAMYVVCYLFEKLIIFKKKKCYII